MTWPFKVPENKVEPEVGDGKSGDGKPPEKTPTELIAESLGPLLKPIQDQITAQNARFDAIEQNTKRPEKTTNHDDNQPVSVLDDENIAFAQRLTPLMARQLELEARIVKGDVKNEYISAGFGDLMTQFGVDIDKIIDSTALVSADGKSLRGDPQYVRNVIDMVLGRAARSAGMRFDGKSKGFFLESGKGGESTNAPTSDGLTDSQRKVMDRMRIPADKAKDIIKKLQFVS